MGIVSGAHYLAEFLFCHMSPVVAADMDESFFFAEAAIVALEALKEHCEVILSTDSQYVRQGITQWIHNWKKRGWKTADKKPVKNVDLWQRLDAALGQHQIKWEWVKGHAGHPENERCDELARAAAMNPTLEDTGYQVEV